MLCCSARCFCATFAFVADAASDSLLQVRTFALVARLSFLLACHDEVVTVEQKMISLVRLLARPFSLPISNDDQSNAQLLLS
jgi:hypothetical protein